MSPDNQQIAYFASIEDGKQWLTVSPIDTPQARTLFEAPIWLSLHDWSPDGRWIAFTTDRTGNQEIYFMNPIGTELINYTRNPAADSHPSWR